MEPQTQNQRRAKEAAQWPAEISYFLLTLLMSKHKEGRSGDNGLRKEVWVQIATVLNARWNTTYDWEQARNHYRIWKSRLKSLSDLQKDSGMRWNDVERRFCAGHHRWADMKKKEQRYWKDHPVLPIHIETLIWLGNEIASGIDATHVSEQVGDSNQADQSADVPELDPMLDLEIEDEPSYTELPTPQSEFSSRRRGRPSGGSSSSKQSKKKMVSTNPLIEPIRELADAIKASSDRCIDKKFAEEINDALFEMYANDTIDKVAISMGFLMKNKWAATSILSAPKDQRVTLLEAIMRTSTSNP